jgi:hypothetical protein
MLYSDPRESFDSTSPLFSGYTSWQGECTVWRTTWRWRRNSILDRSRAWKLTSSTQLRAVQKTWTIRNRYICRYEKICISTHISFERETPNWLHDLRPWCGNRGYTYGDNGVRLARLWWVGAVATRHVQVDLQQVGRPLQKINKPVNKKFRHHLPCTGRLSNPVNKSNSRMADTHIYKWHNGRQSHLFGIHIHHHNI